MPGVEKPLRRDGLAAGGGTSAAGLAGGSIGCVGAFTKIRVNSPGAGGGAWVGTGVLCNSGLGTGCEIAWGC
jgi:hypothetical protein